MADVDLTGGSCAVQPVLTMRGENGEKVLVDIMQLEMTDAQRSAVEKFFVAGGDHSVLSKSEAERIKDLKYRVGVKGNQIFLICRFDVTVVRIDEN